MVNVSVDKVENGKVSLEIEVAPAQVEAALEQAYRKVVRNISIPGFRKGKAPRPLVERHVGMGALYEEALEVMIPDAYQEALEQTKIEPIDQPHVDILQLEKGQPFRFKAEVPVKPDVTLGEYRGVAVEKNVRRITDEDVQAELEALQERNSQLEPTERREVEKGDFVTLDYEGFVDDVPFQGGAAKGQQLEIGSGSFIPGFEDQLIGAAVGEEREIKVTFPEVYHAEELAGKEAVFKATVQEIKVKKTPALDDEFAKDVSDKETLAELKAMIRENLERTAERRSEEALRNRLVELVSESASVEVPEVLVKREADGMGREFLQSLAYRGINPDRYLQESSMTLEELIERFEPSAQERVKASLVLEAIQKAEKIEVTEADIDARIDEMVGDDEGEQAEHFRSHLNEPAMRERLAESLAVSKTIDFLVEHANITVREGDLDEEGDPDEASEDAESEAEEA